MVTSPTAPERVDLPAKLSEALLRGARMDCPRCGEAQLFFKWLKPVENCQHCKHDWSVQQADDFPAYIGIFVVGHLLAPVLIAMISGGMSAALTMAIILPIAVGMLLGMLQPTKGAVIAFLWWKGIGVFVQERRAADQNEQP